MTSCPFDDVAFDLLARGLDVRFVVSGWSMAPVLVDGDAVTVRPGVDWGRGDVVFFRGANGRLLVHRVVGELPGGGVRTRGDAAPEEDAPIARQAVAGCVIARERGGRAVAMRGRAAQARQRLERLAARWWRPLVRRLPGTSRGTALFRDRS